MVVSVAVAPDDVRLNRPESGEGSRVKYSVSLVSESVAVTLPTVAPLTSPVPLKALWRNDTQSR